MGGGQTEGADVSLALLSRWLLFALAFYGCTELGHFLSFPGNQHFATFWPASGLYLAALCLSPRKLWPGYIAAGLMVNGLSEVVLHGTSPALATAFCVANTLEAITGAWLLQRIRRPFDVGGLTDMLWMAALGGLVAPLVGAAIGGAAARDTFPDHSFWYHARVWWMADAVGILAVAPILLTFPSQLALNRLCGPRVWLEAAIVACLIVSSSLIAFGPLATHIRPAPVPAYPFFVAPFLVWCGLRFGRFGTAIGVFLAGVIAIWGTTRGYGLFAQLEPTLELKAAALQVYLIVVSTTPLLFATVIQEQRAAEDRLNHNLQLLADSERRFRTLAAFSPVGIFENDAQGRCIYVNERCCELTGLTLEQMTGFGWSSAIHPDDRQRVVDEARRLIASGGDHFELEYRFQTPEGRVIWVAGAKVALRDAAGQIIGYIGNLVDITERRLAQAAMEDAKTALECRVADRTSDLVAANEQLRLQMVERALAEERLREQQAQLAHAARLSNLGEMAAELAHEVNQPLSAISNYVRGTQRRLQSGNVSVADLAPTLEIIGKEANRAADVVRRTKDFVRKQHPSPVPLDLPAVVREAVAMVAHDLRDQQVELDLRLNAELPQCIADVVQLQQVLVNLLLNAIDALRGVPAGNRRINIAARCSGELVELSLGDSGTGIPREITEKIFDAYYTTKPGGLGLGLPISRGIIEGHGGKLWLEPGDRGGATFCFTLPVWEESDDDDQRDLAGANRVRGG